MRRDTLAAALGPDYSVSADSGIPSGFAAVIGLIATLTLLLPFVGLPVLALVHSYQQSQRHAAERAVRQVDDHPQPAVVCLGKQPVVRDFLLRRLG